MKSILIKTALTITAILFCDPVSLGAMTLDDCLILASEHAYRNRINRLEIKKSAYDTRIAASGLMPRLSFSTDGNISFGRNIDPGTNTYDNSQTLYSGFALQLSIPLFDGLVGINTLKAAKVAELRQQKAAQTEADQVSLEVIRTFYNIAYCKAMVNHMESQLTRDSTDLQATRRCVGLGTKSGADLAGMEALVASDRFALSNQRNLLSKAYLQLKSLMGMELDRQPLELTETDYTPVPSANPHPRIAEAELALTQSRYTLKAAKGAFSPVISFGGGVSTSYYRMMGDHGTAPAFSRQWHDNMGQYAAVSVTIPLFSGLSSWNRARRARTEVLESELRLEQTRYEIEKETLEARLDLDAAEEEYEAAELRLAAEQKAYQAARRKFELGGASAIELYTAGATLAQAKAEREGKRIARIISAITLAYCLGAKLI